MNLLQRTTSKLRERFSSRGLILMYHRVAESDLDPWGLSVSPKHFAEQLEVMKRYFHPLGLQELHKQHQLGKLPNRSIALTFDDGYVDNLHTAKPLLEHYNVSATVFLVTEALVEAQSFWWDELEWALLQPGSLPGSLELNVNGNCQSWQLGDAFQYSLENRQTDQKRRPWDGLPGTRLAFFYSVWRYLIQLSQPERIQCLDAISTWSGMGTNSRGEVRALNVDEVKALGKGAFVELGAHTVTHPSLSSLPAVKQQEEIQSSKAQLEEIIGRPVTSFSYPHGDYSLETAALVRKSGFQCACTTKSECILPGADLFQLPRFQVEDWDGNEFLRRLARWYILS